MPTCGKCRVPHLVAEVEMGAVDPQRTADSRAPSAHTGGTEGSSYEATRALTSSSRGGGSSKKMQATSNVLVDLPILEVKELGIERPEPRHLPSLLPVGTPLRTLRPKISPTQGPLAGVFSARTPPSHPNRDFRP